MSAPKKYLRMTISFGRTNNPSRKIIEEFIKNNGRMKVSKLIQEALQEKTFNKDNKQYHIQELLLKRQEIVRQRESLLVALEETSLKLKNLGYKGEWDA